MEHPHDQPLPPVQRIMLLDSWDEPNAGHHVEQLEIIFSPLLDVARIESAWRATVASCEVLRMTFGRTTDGWLEQFPATIFPEMVLHSTSPPSWDSWLETDRLRPLLIRDSVPWRTAFWPASRRWLWTFHHALLDGRSITRILRAFLTSLHQKACEDVPLPHWQSPSGMAVEIATGVFSQIRRECPRPRWPRHFATDSGPAVRHLGPGPAESLHGRATAMKVTAATVVTWAWGQALANFLGTDAVLVEQIRAGAPQPKSAGFTMHVLPLMISRGCAAVLPGFQAQLLAMRAFETVSPDDFPPDVYPETADAPVIMVEHATLAHALGEDSLLESVRLHEHPADFPSATAFLRPDLRLKVEGPHRNDLLARWCAVLESADFCIAGSCTAAGKLRR